MTTLMTAPELLADLTGRGFTVRTTNGAIAVTPASALSTADREAIRERRAELLGILSAGEVWDAATASCLMFDADSLVESLGVDGRHPAIANAAATAVIAQLAHDMTAFRNAISEFVVLVRRLAAVRSAHKAAGERSE